MLALSPIIEFDDVLLPPGKGDVWYFPGAQQQGGKADIVARIRRRDGSSWYACLARTDMRFGLTPDIFEMPDGESVYLAEGVADRDAPTSWKRVSVDPVCSVIWPADRRFVLFNDYQRIEVFGATGQHWLSRPLGLEVRILNVTDARIDYSHYDPATGDDRFGSLDFATGKDG
jgi:hypothetical protein